MEEDKIYLNSAGNYFDKKSIVIDEINNCIYVPMNGFKLKIALEKYKNGLSMIDLFTAEIINN